MQLQPTTNTVEHPFQFVKSPVNSQLPLFSDSMIHHKPPLSRNKVIVSYKNGRGYGAYAVSPSRRVLTSSLFLKKYDYIWGCLKQTLGLPLAQREVVIRLLRLYAYYGRVYPKESQITEDPGCSKATFWRTVRLLEKLGLLQVVSRYVIRPHAQISNLYRLDRLVLVITRYLAEHGTQFREKWLKPMLTVPGSQFWRRVFAVPLKTDFEGCLAFTNLTPPGLFK